MDSSVEISTGESSKSIVVIGGGIGGLFSAWRLLKKGYEVTVLERQNNVGGLSTSIPFEDYKMDIGPHFVTCPKNSELTTDIQALMDDKIIPIPDIHQAYRVFFKNQVLKKYPTLYEIIFKNGISSLIKSFFSYFGSKIKNRDTSNFKSVEEYLSYNYGNYLYKTWFKPYLDFTYGTKNIPIETIKEKFPIIKFKDIIQKTRKKKSKENVSEDHQSVIHWYFKFGMGTLPNVLSENIKNLGGKIILGVDVKKINHENMPKEITIVKNSEEKILKTNNILYTTPPNVTKNWFEQIQKFDFKSSLSTHCIMVFLFIDIPKVVDWWVLTNYDSNLPFYRITHQNHLSEFVCPPGKSLLCVEISTKENEELWNLDELELIKIVKNGLRVMNLFDTKKIENYKIFRFKNLYHGVEPNGNLIGKKIADTIDTFKNEFMVGVEIDAGTLVTQRLEEENSNKPSVNFGGVYMTLENSQAVVKKIIQRSK